MHYAEHQIIRSQRREIHGECPTTLGPDFRTLCVLKIRYCDIGGEATENRVGGDGAGALDRAMERRVLVQGTMDPRLIIVCGISA